MLFIFNTTELFDITSIFLLYVPSIQLFLEDEYL